MRNFKYYMEQVLNKNISENEWDSINWDDPKDSDENETIDSDTDKEESEKESEKELEDDDQIDDQSEPEDLEQFFKEKEITTYKSFNTIDDMIRFMDRNKKMGDFLNIEKIKKTLEEANLKLGENIVKIKGNYKEEPFVFEIIIVKTPNDRIGIKSAKKID